MTSLVKGITGTDGRLFRDFFHALVALMKDQVDALQASGVAATFLNSALDSATLGKSFIH